MYTNRSKIDTGVSVSFIISAVIHMAAFLLLAWHGRLFLPQVAIQETYYVDVVNLPVSHPLPGSSQQQAAETEAVAPQILAPAPQMAVPLQPPKVIAKPDTKRVMPVSVQSSSESESAFAERMAKLERISENRRAEAVLEKLRKKVNADGRGKAGVPDAGGTVVGSRYANYIKSRLEDALKTTSNYTTNNPELTVRLTIGTDGSLLRTKVEHSSGDTAFQLAVMRAIDLASKEFTAPPNQTVFENGFVFRPKGISSGTSR